MSVLITVAIGGAILAALGFGAVARERHREKLQHPELPHIRARRA